MSTATLAAGPHLFVDDGSGQSCDDCGLPPKHARHITPDAPPPHPKPVADLGVSLTPEQTETSQRAALSVWPKAGTQRARILDAVAACGEYGATDDELVWDTDLPGNTVRPRRGELVDAGWLIAATDAAGHPRVRPTTSGHDAQVWVLSAAAREHAA